MVVGVTISFGLLIVPVCVFRSKDSVGWEADLLHPYLEKLCGKDGIECQSKPPVLLVIKCWQFHPEGQIRLWSFTTNGPYSRSCEIEMPTCGYKPHREDWSVELYDAALADPGCNADLQL
ncbi:hypothetical protein OS493_005568 [Desmophyllum pertusum]|uniref:S-protein homolog n=1 Tax=Desmophyllum pertusum TaxID=174260 RepID=A0A9X0CMC9_9CNID|nr:hypothetical protein OS493_005568 [Desmophyllum pertusum]